MAFLVGAYVGAAVLYGGAIVADASAKLARWMREDENDNNKIQVIKIQVDGRGEMQKDQYDELMRQMNQLTEEMIARNIKRKQEEQKLEEIMERTKKQKSLHFARLVNRDQTCFANMTHEMFRMIERGMDHWKREFGDDIFEKVNIGVFGAVNMGKSSLVNALRGLRDDHKDAAAVSIVEERTSIVMYSRNMSGYNFNFADTPGWGTANHKTNSFHMDHELNLFDHVILVTNNGMYEQEIEFRNYCEKYGVPYSIVCTKVDIAMYNATQSDDVEIPSEEYDKIKSEIRAKLTTQYQSEGVEGKLFLISAVNIRKKMGKNFTDYSAFDEEDFIKYIGDTMVARYNVLAIP